MNRRGFVGLLASAAVALGLRKEPEAPKAATMFEGEPINWNPPKTEYHFLRCSEDSVNIAFPAYPSQTVWAISKDGGKTWHVHEILKDKCCKGQKV